MDSRGTPLVSIVAATRNDDHGGNMRGRMQLFVDCLDALCEKHRLTAELVLVEWNPPADRPPLRNALEWAREPRSCAVRIITVPPEVHARFKYGDSLPLFQMIGKNVGIRRARGTFVLATNVDILLADELVAFLASNELGPGRLYRADRYDVPSDPPEGVPVDEVLHWCAANVLRFNGREATVHLATGERHMIYGSPTKRAPLHTNGCGDFQLMAAPHWFEVRGYPEFEMYSMFLDGLLSYAAHFAGARETILADPCRIHHIEHGGGWSPDETRTKALSTRLRDSGVPHLAHSTFDAWAREMTRAERPIIFNDEHWGLADESLDEEQVVQGSWHDQPCRPATRTGVMTGIRACQEGSGP